MNDTPFILTLDPGIERMNAQPCDLNWLVTNLSYGAFLKKEDALNTEYYFFWPEMFTVAVNTEYYAQLASKNPFNEAMKKLSGYEGVLAQQKRGMIGTPIQRAILLSSSFFNTPERREMVEGLGFNLERIAQEFQKAKPTVVIPKEGFLPWYASGQAVEYAVATYGHTWSDSRKTALTNATFFPVPGFPGSGHWPCAKERALGNLLRNACLNQFGIDHVYSLTIARFIERHDLEVWLTAEESVAMGRTASAKADGPARNTKELHALLDEIIRKRPSITDAELETEVVARMGNNYCRYIPCVHIRETASAGKYVAVRVSVSHNKITNTKDAVQAYCLKRHEKKAVEAVTVDDPAKKNQKTTIPSST